jgi:AraC-like DNA-binding protein
MRPHLLKVPGRVNNSFSCHQYSLPNINSRWHYHLEIELIQIHKGSGTQFMGDSVRPFKAGDIILVGSNLPHFWRYDDDFNLDADDNAKPFSTVIHFTEKLWGELFMGLPENFQLKRLFEKAKRGLFITGDTNAKLTALINDLVKAQGTYRLVYLLECLACIVKNQDYISLSSLGFEYSPLTIEHDRINTIYDYSFNHYLEKIPLKTIAYEAGLAPGSFCRYFKSKTGKNFTDFILELRIAFACKLLLEDRYPVKDICFRSGFHNFSSFHKHFKAINGVSPQAYQKIYIAAGTGAVR